MSRHRRQQRKRMGKHPLWVARRRAFALLAAARFKAALVTYPSVFESAFNEPLFPRLLNKVTG